MSTPLLPAEALSALCLQLYELQKAGISPEESLVILSEDTHASAERELFQRLTQRVEEGESLSNAMKQETCFPNYMISMISIGEHTGNLDTVLHALSGYYDRERILSSSIKSAVVYPAIMAIMMTALLIVLTVFVLPSFSDAFVSLGIQLSPVAQVLMLAGQIIAPIAIVAILGALIGGFVVMRRRAAGKPTPLDHLSISRQIVAGRFISALALMLRSGIDTSECFERSAALSGREEIIKAANLAILRISDEGISLTEALQSLEMLSGAHLRMLRVGERAGRFDTMLEEISNRLTGETAAKTDRLIAGIEPTIVVTLATVAGLILLSVMLPLLGVLSAAG